MQKKPDFGSMVLIVAFAIIITVIIYMSAVHVIDSFIVGTTTASLYSKPTWPDPTPVPTTESTEETEETSEEEIEDDEEDYEE